MTTFRLRVGAHTDIGQTREVNQDAVTAEGPIYAVADGMGGHRGGEVASAIAVEVIGRGLDEATPAAFDAAVQAANQEVLAQGTAREELAGMGTTIVAIAEIDLDGEPHLVIGNVGDSRGYLLRGSDLVQITEDHSLVAELVRAGRITPEEAETHPRRNIVTRVLGLDEEVEVDQFAILPAEGDRFLLCSDGLFNEVDDAEIAATLRRIDDPDEAARTLVEMANEGGGRDNITVLVIDVLDDGGRAEAASAAIADDPSTLDSRSDALDDLGAAVREDHPEPPAPPPAPVESHDEPSAHEPSEPATDGGADLAGFDTALSDEQLAAADETIDPDDELEDDVAGGFSWRVATFLAVAFVVLGVAVGALLVYARSSYFVGFDGERVAIFQGRPGGVLIFDPTLEAHTDVVRDDLLPVAVERVEREPEYSSFGDADDFVANLQLVDDDRAPQVDEPGSFDD